MSRNHAVAAALLWTMACTIGLKGVVIAIVQLRGDDVDLVTLGAAAALVYTLGSWGALGSRAAGASPLAVLAFRPTQPWLGLVGLGLGLALKVPAESLRLVMERLVPTSESALLNKALLYRVHDFGDVVALVLVVCVVGPLVEEMFFRGALYARLCHGMTARGAAVRAAFVSSLLFVVSHEDARDWPSLVVVALVLGLLRAVSGSLLPCLALHVAFNSVGALALVSGVASATRPMALSTFAVVASWVAAGGLVIVLARLASAPESARARSQDGP